SALHEAAQLLHRAERPVIYAGGGVVAGNASGTLRELAELLQCPVVMSANGRGALDDRHALALTWMAGRAVLAEADLVLGVGTRFMAGTDPGSLPPPAGLGLFDAAHHDLGAPRSPALGL